MTHDFGSSVKHAGYCEHDGKVRFLSRKDARRIAKRLGHHLNAYRCDGYWHNGTLPHAIKAGTATRDDLRRRA